MKKLFFCLTVLLFSFGSVFAFPANDAIKKVQKAENYVAWTDVGKAAPVDNFAIKDEEGAGMFKEMAYPAADIGTTSAMVNDAIPANITKKADAGQFLKDKNAMEVKSDQGLNLNKADMAGIKANDATKEKSIDVGFVEWR